MSAKFYLGFCEHCATLYVASFRDTPKECEHCGAAVKWSERQKCKPGEYIKFGPIRREAVPAHG